MAESTTGFGVRQAKGPFEPIEFNLLPLGPEDLEIEVTHCGICFSDIHSVDGHWGNRFWPLIPGHEIVGVVVKKGDKVNGFPIGQRVGVGPQAGSCHKCKQCQGGTEQYCRSAVGTYGSPSKGGYTQGGYSLRHRTQAHFAVPIPDDLKSEDCAPLLCAGATTFTPLKDAKVGPGKKVGVLGVGGLGHIAIRFAVAMGAHVVAISHSPDKRDLCLNSLGAHEFINSSVKAEMTKAQKSFDLILNTVSVVVAWDPFLALLKPGEGRFHTVSAPEAPGTVSIGGNRLLQGLTIMGSSVGAPGEIREMLDFCVRHKVTCMTEVMPFEKTREAVEKVRANKARFRMVLAMPKTGVKAKL